MSVECQVGEMRKRYLYGWLRTRRRVRCVHFETISENDHERDDGDMGNTELTRRRIEDMTAQERTGNCIT